MQEGEGGARVRRPIVTAIGAEVNSGGGGGWGPRTAMGAIVRGGGRWPRGCVPSAIGGGEGCGGGYTPHSAPVPH